jgi:hypothetical protein
VTASFRIITPFLSSHYGQRKPTTETKVSTQAHK